MPPKTYDACNGDAREPGALGRLPGPYLTRSSRAFSLTLTTTVFSQRSSGRFGACPRRPAPEGQPPSFAQHRFKRVSYMTTSLCVRDAIEGLLPSSGLLIFGPELWLPAPWIGTTSALTRNSRSSVPRCEQQSFTLGPCFVTEAKWTAPRPVRDPYPAIALANCAAYRRA
jgi:hypothetical protein